MSKMHLSISSPRGVGWGVVWGGVGVGDFPRELEVFGNLGSNSLPMSQKSPGRALKFTLNFNLRYPRSHLCVKVFCKIPTGRGSLIGSEFVWHASGPEFDPQVRHILSWRLGHENISTAILPLPLIQEEQLSVTGERMCTKYW